MFTDVKKYIALFFGLKDMKEASKGLLRPVMEYESSVWDPHTFSLFDELQKMQMRSAKSRDKK